MGSLVFFCRKGQCQHLLPVPGGQGGMWGGSPCCWPATLSPSPNLGVLHAVEEGVVGTVSDAQGPRRGPWGL